MSTDPDRQRRPPASSLGTVAALMGVGLALLAVLAFLMVAGGPLFLGIIGVLIGIPMFIGFNYITWGWWMCQLRDDDDR